ncbi:MAG: NmrA/HSCARG family protein [Gemmatimonadota bacterium]|jgi:uncharacterized protein YbjT (DUF2867 family)
MSDRIIAVVGATGAQGGGLARAILADPDGGFAVRALTRRPDSDAARALADRGAEIVRADLDDAGSVRRAFDGAYGAYCVTNFWEHFSPEKEQAQARTMAEAAADAGVEHVIWSTLDDTRERVPLDDDRMPTLMGEYKVPHFDAKGEADRYFREAGAPTTFLQTVFYWDNLIHFGMGPRRGEDGVARLVLPMGDKKLPSIAVEDIGRCAYGVFQEGTGLVGQTVGIAGGHPTGAQMAEGLTEALGEEVVYQDVPPDVYRSFGFPGAEDLGNMFQFKQEFEEAYCASRPVDRSRELNPALQSFDAWARANADRIEIQEGEG